MNLNCTKSLRNEIEKPHENLTAVSLFHTLSKNQITVQEDQIIAGLRARDRKTTEYLYEKYSLSLYSVICKTISHPHLADEVFHDSFLKITNDIDTYNCPKGHLYSWMAWICRSCAKKKV